MAREEAGNLRRRAAGRDNNLMSVRNNRAARVRRVPRALDLLYLKHIPSGWYQPDGMYPVGSASPVRAIPIRWNRARFHLIGIRSSLTELVSEQERDRAAGDHLGRGAAQPEEVGQLAVSVGAHYQKIGPLVLGIA
jgi:hypothetical protein